MSKYFTASGYFPHQYMGRMSYEEETRAGIDKWCREYQRRMAKVEQVIEEQMERVDEQLNELNRQIESLKKLNSTE